MGNTVTQNAEGNTVVAQQEVNPSVLGAMSNAANKPGADMLHEVTEAYQGALISQRSGVSAGLGNDENVVYTSAHAAATKQTSDLNEEAYDKQGNQLQKGADGRYNGSVYIVDYSVPGKSGAKTIVQTLVNYNFPQVRLVIP